MYALIFLITPYRYTNYYERTPFQMSIRTHFENGLMFEAPVMSPIYRFIGFAWTVHSISGMGDACIHSRWPKVW